MTLQQELIQILVILAFIKLYLSDKDFRVCSRSQSLKKKCANFRFILNFKSI